MNVSVVIKDPFKLFVSNWLTGTVEDLLTYLGNLESIPDIDGRDILEVTLEYRDYITEVNPEEEGYSFPLFVHCRLSKVGIPARDLYINLRRGLRETGYLVTVHGHEGLRAKRRELKVTLRVVTRSILDGYVRSTQSDGQSNAHLARSVK